MRNFKEFISILALLLLTGIAEAQFVNKGKIISVAEGSVVTVQTDMVNEGAIRNAGTIYLSGDWTNINSYLSQNGKFVLNGNTVQQVNHNGQTFYTLELAGGGTKVFNSDVEVISELILISGIAEIADSKTFLLREDVLVTGGSDISHIDGPLYRTGTGNQFYPIGTNGNYAPVELLDVTGSNPVTGMQVHEPNPASTPGFGVSEVSTVRYWQRTLASGSFSDARIRITLNNESQITDINRAVVAVSNTVGGEFTSLGQEENTGNGNDGTLTGFDRTNGQFFAAARELNEGRKSDSLALVRLYELSGGPDWINNTGWLQAGANLDNWFGVVIDNSTERVAQVNLPDNNLSGTLTSQIRLMDELTTLDLSGNSLSGNIPSQLAALNNLSVINLSDNNFTSMPDLTALSAVLSSLDVTNNQLLFASLESNRNLPGFTYSPQDSLSNTGGYFLFDRGQDFTLEISEGSTNNSYQWLLNEVPISGATDRIYQITDLNRANMGDYRCEITNSVVTDLVITSKVTTILAKADISGSLYVSDTEPLTAGEIRLLKVTETGAYEETEVKPLLPTGTYDFENVILGDYVVIADPFDDELYLPTYHESEIQWDLADVIMLNNDTTGLDVFIESVPVPFTPDDGNGVVGGEIFTDFPEDGRIEARRRVRRVGVALRRRRSSGRTDNEFDDFDLVAYTETDDEGKFEFPNLPPGTYRIYIEFPGIPVDPSSFTEFELGEDLDENEITVEATVYEDGIVIEKVEETGVPYDYIDALEIYPNPAVNGYINIAISARRGYELRLELLDLRGVAVRSEILNSANLGNGTKKLDISELGNGIYLLKITVPSYQDQLYKVGRIVINNR